MNEQKAKTARRVLKIKKLSKEIKRAEHGKKKLPLQNFIELIKNIFKS